MPAPSPEQLKASNPALSAWVAANAGSGKTSVLVNRVVRLLLAGADPARILCVTFTKAAAANMQDRIFQRLGEWVALPDDALAAAMAEMEGVAPHAAQLKVARRLFARAVETPGGLKIQTIHALCERLLHLFPFEAAVPARFEMLDEAQAAASLDRAMAGTLREALSTPGTPLAEALGTVADAAGEDGVRQALKAFVRHRRGLMRPAPERKLALSPVRAALGIGPGETAESVAGQLFTDGLPITNWQEVADWLATGTKTDVERAADLRKARGVQGQSDCDLYIAIFITRDGGKRKVLATKKPAEARPDLLEDLTAEQDRVFDLLDHMKAAAAAERTEAITLLADEVLARHEAEKRRLGRLDFQDLITRTRALLTSDAARWVLFKLDQGVDHILVDEAQDTSPEQWDIVKALADEFFDGAGARGALNRTVFAVGDEKQSIFGFQGAKPEEFDTARKHFARRISAHNAEATQPRAFDTVSLQTSYRTTDDILSAVDQIFSLPANYHGLESANQPTVHVSNRVGAPGLVELWPPMEPPEAPDKDAAAPVDERPPDSAPQRLADRIARRIAWWMRHPTPAASTGAPITPGDVLVLVRNRGSVFDCVIKALKKHGVPVAGADRMKLGQQLAVMDLMSLGRFCVSPDDDLALAEVLRSPLVDVSETELFTLAQGRGEVSLWQALQANVAECPAFARAESLLQDCLRRAQEEDPARFYAGLLAASGFRKNIMSRLSVDAAEAIDVFLYRIRQWQAANPPSLLLFLEDMQGDESDVKRDMEEAHGRVRVMTVHGSKGLEAPVVFLADLFRAPGGGKSARLFEVVSGDAETAVWSPHKDDEPAAAAAGRARIEEADMAEYRRLLYVGLTRAKDRLIIAGARPGRAVSGTWHDLVEAGLAGDARLTSALDETGEGEVRQWRTVRGEVELKDSERSAHALHPPFPWLHVPASADLPRPPPIRPSRLADAAEPPPMRDRATARSAARLRGDLVHLLLQHLPEVSPGQRRLAGERLAALRFPALDALVRTEALDSVLALVDHGGWAELFGPEARAEVDIAGRITVEGRALEVAGRIDRLMVTQTHVLVADFKTGRAPDNPAEIPEGHLRQMAVYWTLARDLYPTRKVEAAVIWTALPVLVVLDKASMEAALSRLENRPTPGSFA